MSHDPWVLLVDDDVEFGRILEAFLRKLGVRLVVTTNPADFAARLKAKTPSACLVDLHLGGVLAGYALVKSVRKKWKVPLIVVSGTTDQAAISYAIECGADDFIAKPLNPALLNAKLSRYLRPPGEGPDDPLVSRPTPPGGIPATIGYGIHIAGIDEIGCRIVSPHFLCKGAPLYLQGDVIAKAFPARASVLASVTSCELIASGDYQVVAEFAELNSNDQASLRKFLFEHTAASTGGGKR